MNLLTYLVWLKRRGKNENYDSPLVEGSIGAYVTLLVIAFLLIMSLRDADFRMGFYAAGSLLLIIGISYRFAFNTSK